MLEAIATVGAFIVVFCYFLSIRLDKPAIFDWANVVGSVMMAPINIVLGLQFAVALNLTFGGLGAYGIGKRSSQKRRAAALERAKLEHQMFMEREAKRAVIS